MIKLEEIFFKNFFLSPEIIIIRKGKDGIVFEVSDSFCKLLGYSRKSVIGKRYEGLNLFAENKNKSIYLNNCISNKKTENLNLKLYKKNRDVLEAILTEEIIEVDGDQYFVTIVKYGSETEKVDTLNTIDVIDKTMGIENSGAVSDDKMIQIERFVSDRNRAERFLSDSEKRHRSFFDDLPIGAYRTTEDGRFLSVNPTLALILGFDNPDDVKKYNASDFYIRSEDRTALIEKQKKVYGIVKAEYKVRRMDGNFIWIRDNGKVILKENGEIDYLEGVIEDITSRKIAQDSLIESEVKYRKLFENLYDIYFSITVDGEITEISPSAEAILGFSSEEVIGKSISDFVDNRQFLNDALSDLKKSLKILNRALQIKDRQGRNVYLLVNAYFYYDNISDKKCIAGIARDITQQKRNETDLLESREYAELINRVTPSCTFTIDKNGYVTSWNERAAIITGYPVSEVIGKK